MDGVFSQRLKPGFDESIAARLKPCPDTNPGFFGM
jgi:hypothetical protein